MTEEKLTFEQGLEQLEKTVQEMERGEMPLEASIQAYERARTLEARLRKMLEDMDGRIRVLTDEGEEPFEVNDDEDAE